MRFRILLLLTALGAPAVAHAAQDVSFAGVWVRDARASRVNSGTMAQPAEKVLTIVHQGRKGFGYTAQIAYPNGGRRAYTVLGALDGKYRPRAGDTGTMAFDRIGPWGFRGRWTFGGKRKGTEACAIAVDFKSLVCRGSETDANGRKVSWVDVYRRRPEPSAAPTGFKR
jgi:hypothetical protein